MKKLKLNLEGKLVYKGQLVIGKPIGKSKVLWHPKGEKERDEIRFHYIMRGFAQTVATSEIPDSYLEGEKLNRDNICYTPIQFYKIEI